MLAEIFRHTDEIFLAKILTAEEKHGIVKPRVVDRPDGPRIERVAEIDTANLCSNVF